MPTPQSEPGGRSAFGIARISAGTARWSPIAGRVVADPFMGGGTALIKADRVGCDVLGFDINPMAAWIVREEIEHLDPSVPGRGQHAPRVLPSIQGKIAFPHLYCDNSERG